MMENYFFDATQSRGPLMSKLGEAITGGRDTMTYLWQAPGNQELLQLVKAYLRTIMVEAQEQGRYQLIEISKTLLTAVRASPSPQQMDVLASGFDQMYRLWAAGAQLEVTPLP